MSRLFDPDHRGPVLQDPSHRAWLRQDAERQLAFFRQSLLPDGRFAVMNHDGTVADAERQELHTTTRLVHSYALGKAFGFPDCDAMIDAGMAALWNRHRDTDRGGYVWSVTPSGVGDTVKLAYGHVFVLLAASSARHAGHPDADRLLADISEVIDRHYWDAEAGLLRDEFARDWLPFSGYRGMNANMHGVEAMLAAYEATGDGMWLDRAGRILGFFVGRIGPAHEWRLPEHYTEDWQVDPDYAGDPMFRPAGTTPGHSLELARLRIQHWDLSGRADDAPLRQARALVTRALEDAWCADGGLAYTLKPGGGVDIADRYWWPVTEAIGVLASLLKVDPQDGDAACYRRLWTFAAQHFVDAERGGWVPEIDEAGQPAARQFTGKPDIYHALQADLLPLAEGVSRQMGDPAAAA